MGAEAGFAFDDALRAVAASDPRWGGTDTDDPQFGRMELERFAHSLAFVLDEPPRWIETVAFPGVAGTEIRVLTERSLVVASTPWAAGDAGPEPTVKVRPLRLLRELDVDGFVADADGRPTGCTITLLFGHGQGVRLGGASGADRSALSTLLPSLMAALGV